MIIILGAMMSMCLIYLFRLQDARLQLVGVFAFRFPWVVFLMILLNDRPFFGHAGIEPDSYTELGWMIKRPNPFGARANIGKDKGRPDWQEACRTLVSPPMELARSVRNNRSVALAIVLLSYLMLIVHVAMKFGKGSI